MFISSWKDIYEGLENKIFTDCFIVTAAFDVKLGNIKFSCFIDAMDDLIISLKTLKNEQILQFNSLDAGVLETSTKPFFMGLGQDDGIATYYRIKFPKLNISIIFRQKYK